MLCWWLLVNHNVPLSKIQGFFGLIRPFTLLAPLVVSLSIMIASFYYQQLLQPLLPMLIFQMIPASFSLSLLNGASNALNQATDIDADRISKPYRPIPKGIISVKEAKIIALLLYIASFTLAFMIHTSFVVFMAMITFFTISYSLQPRMKDKLFYNQLWIAVPRGFLGILASWSVFGNVFDPLPLTIAFIAGLFLFGGSITKDFSDRKADELVGTKTLVNIYGVRKAAFIVLPFLFFPFLLIPISIDFGLIPSYFWLLTFLAIPGFFIFKAMIKNTDTNTIFENTSAWSYMYITYFVFAIAFSVITVAGTFIFM